MPHFNYDRSGVDAVGEAVNELAMPKLLQFDPIWLLFKSPAYRDLWQ